MDAAKIRLSTEEAALIMNAQWILTKNAILEKVKDLLAVLQEQQQQWLQQCAGPLPTEVLQSSAKISRGENYRGLPYLVLDQPRLFEKDNVFAMRTMFWWGHFFSVTLQLSGTYKLAYAENIIAAYPLLEDYYIGTSADPWQHHYEEDNYRPVAALSQEEFAHFINTHPFIKLSFKIPVSAWEDAGSRLSTIAKQLTGFLLSPAIT